MATLLGLTPQQKAALVVVSGLPAPPGVGGVIVQGYDRDAARPPGALVFVDQEGGKVKTFPRLPPRSSARAVRSAAAAYASGRATGVALRGAGGTRRPALFAPAALRPGLRRRTMSLLRVTRLISRRP